MQAGFSNLPVDASLAAPTVILTSTFSCGTRAGGDTGDNPSEEN